MLIRTSSVALCISVYILLSFSNVGAMPRNPCDDIDCNGNGVCQVVANARSPVRATCRCNKHFKGPQCATLISRRCYYRPDAPEGIETSSKIAGIINCPAGQWCMPDNWYCHFYACANSIGWCIKASSTFVQTDISPTTLTRKGKDFRTDFFSGEQNTDDD